jgi:hypothetical protein
MTLDSAPAPLVRHVHVVRALVFLLLLPLWGQLDLSAEDGAETSPPVCLRIPRVRRPPKLSDFLAGIPREAELVLTNFQQYMPGDGAPVSQPTKAFLSYDERNIYVAVICEDDPKLIRARFAKREQIETDDRVSILLDTFHDHRHMYWFDVNPYGVQMDGNVTDGVEDDPTWDTLWDSDGKITGDGYAVMATIPFKSLRFPNDKEQTWGLIIGRWIMRNNEFSLWPHISRRRPGFVQQGGDLEGFRDISPGRNIQLIPYGLFSRSRYLDTGPWNNPQFQTENEARVGIDGKVVLKDALTLDVTLNPDFSQVESDEPQVTVNQRYEVYFPEKRPFFMESAGYFKTPEQLFFSRRIVNPQLGVRLTGRVGKWTLGAVATDDRAPSESVGKGDPPWNRRAAIGVVRLQRDLGRNSNAAVMATSSDIGRTYNRVFSLDARLQLLRNWILTGQTMTSIARLEDGRRLAGPAYYVQWAHAGRHLISETRYTDRSPSFRAALGYFDRVDIREARHTVGYNWRPEGGAVLTWGPKITGAINYNREGRLRDWYVNPEFDVEMTRQTRFAVRRYETYELFNSQGFRWFRNEVSAESEPRKWLAFQASFGKGQGINYHPGPALDPFLARALTLKAGFTLRPDPHTRIEETYLYSGLKTADDSEAPRGKSIFNNHILRSRVDYQFNRKISARAIVDYNSVLPNSTLVSLEKAKHISVDALFTYMVNPGTALYVGYTDLYENLQLDPLASPALSRTQFPGLNTGRQVFVKVSYLLRF